ncbi:RNA binding MEX3B isoform 1 [Schistosoma japonicum]|uniref:RNA binding MEX3B isoform 1 n=2 Tax=Schistosoma japonicum TaxID=6182 RepID=A0A4Z2DP70_SCHJA|nr:RNA binding MEX3B [Schistosoma japonicum]TNN18301.1 RNA binding MEX3B isoform 1 [Schistosoma japonicum]
MPTVSMANFDGEDLLSARLLSFMSNGDQSNSDGQYHMSGNNDFNQSNLCSLMSESGNTCFSIGSSSHRNIQTPQMCDRTSSGISSSPSNENGIYGGVPVSPISGSSTPPPTVISQTDFADNFQNMRHTHIGAPPYSALTSPCLSNKLGSIPQHSLLNLTGGAGDRHSLQNSPFYNHYPGNLQTHLQRQFPGLSPGPAGTLFSNGVSGFGTASQNLISRNGLYQDAAFSLPGFRPTNSSSTYCPQRELFPAIHSSHPSNSCHNFIGPGLLMQDRLHYYAIAQKHGFIVGAELERIKENSRRSTSQSYGRISAYFRNRYGETEAKTKAAYLQLGVRVPSKDHVSEIVGKGGQKIKLIREETGALITTPGEQEEHVFIIEAPPEIAMRVAQHLATRAQEITQSKIVAGERRRGSTSSQPCGTDTGLNMTNGSSGNSGLNLTPSGSNNFVIPNTCPSVSGLLSLNNSVNNSPLHPSTTVNVPFNSSIHSTNSSLRSPNATIFTPSFSSLPASPGNSNSLNSQMQTNTITSNGVFSSTSTPGSRVLLARGRISVPQEMVGKIIGTQGSIITTIQKDTGTEIKSPPKEAVRGPNATSEFEISAYQGLGLSSNQAAECRVQQAKQLIGHLVMRQLERRASEEVEEASGSSNISSEEQRVNGSSAPAISNICNSTSKTNCGGNNGWMWPDVAQMDSQEAREVLDRILAESKNKTRRAKELAVVSTGPSPTSVCPITTMNAQGSLINLKGCNGSQSLSGDNQHSNHFQSHLLNGNYFDGNQAKGCEDMNPGDISVSSGNSGNQCALNDSRMLPTPFNLNNGHFNHRSSTTSTDGSSNGFQMCIPRTVQSFDLSPSNEFLTNMNRPPNLVSDIWNSVAPSFSSVQTDSSSQLHGYVGSSCSTLNNLMNSSSPNRNSNSLICSNRVINSRALDNAFDTAIFDFSDTRRETDGDISPTILLHNRLQQEQDLHQPLTRRHSDWIVPSSHLLTELTADSGGITSSPGRNIAVNDNEANSHSYSVNNFNFIHDLDQLCLSSPCDKDPTVNGTSSVCTTLSNCITVCPPGFETHDHNENESVFTLKPESLINSTKLWSSSNTRKVHNTGSVNSNNHINATKCISLAHNLPPSSTDPLIGSRLFSNTSVLQRLFSNPAGQLSNTVSTSNHDLNISSRISSSIWPQTNNDHIPICCSSNGIDDSFGFSYLENENQFQQQHHQADTSTQSSAFFHENLSDYTGSNSINNNGTENTTNGSQSARCGAIGEGRRRGRPSPNLLSADNDAMALSVSSSLASITEVA